MNQRTALAAILLGCLLVSACDQTAERHAADVLQVSLPLRTALGDIYLDGGSVGLILVDASGNRIEFRWDNGMGTPPEDRGRLLIRRSGQDFVPLEPTSPEAQAGALLVRQWLRDEYPEEVLSRLEEAPSTYDDEYRVHLAQKLSGRLLEARQTAN